MVHFPPPPSPARAERDIIRILIRLLDSPPEMFCSVRGSTGPSPMNYFTELNGFSPTSDVEPLGPLAGALAPSKTQQWSVLHFTIEFLLG